MNNIKPRVIISKCIEFDHCRYNGQIISSEQVKELQPFIEFIPICPEYEIGLGIPRDPIRIVQKNQQQQLLQPNTGKNVTEQMNKFASSFLQQQKNIDGFILKSRSPSCGLKEVKIYSDGKSGATIEKNAGFFARAVLQSFSHLAIEDEGRLRNPTIREHFLRKVYTYARFRAVKDKQQISDLINFHTDNKFLFLAYNQSKLKKLGQLVANAKNISVNQAFSEYEKNLYELFARSPRCSSNINILFHSFGYISDNLSKDEKDFFLKEIEKYRQSHISLASIISILKSWIIRFNEPYLKRQTYFSPYPEELVHAENIDSCLSKDYWK
ncbi:MAG: DUF523 and DUF1722 domain-containing protein [Thermoplasmatota archaeon]